MEVVRYAPEMRPRWDEFVRCSSNGTFLHLRGYMDYHSDRFCDWSLMIYDDKRRLMAVLPGNASDATFYSHQGLTYGGMLVGRRHSSTSTMLEAWTAVRDYLRREGFRRMVYKPVPEIYCRYPAADDVYCLFRLGATMTACQVSSTIPAGEPWLANETARQTVKALTGGCIAVGESRDFSGFMQILADRLASRYGVRPVHSVEEIEMLAGRFPENIKLFVAVDQRDGSIMAGTIVYVTDAVVHTQYIATTEAGRRVGAMAAVVRHLLDAECAGRRYLDFGTSCEDGGRVLNAGLNAQKYGLGGRPTIYQTFTLEL